MTPFRAGSEQSPYPPPYQPPYHPSPAPFPPPGGVPGSQAEQVRELGQTMPLPGLDGEPSIHCVTIIGQVEGHVVLPPKNKTTRYEHVIPQLVAVEQNPRIKGLLVLLNTVGGDIEAGLAIAEMVKTLSKPTVSLILGGGHSIGAPIAVAADYSFITETATVTIHPVRLTGMVIGVPQTYEYLDKMQDRIIRFIRDNSRISEERLRELMFRVGELVRDAGTVLIGKEAVEVGLIDALGGLSDAVRKLQELIAAAAAGFPAKRPRGPAPPPPGGPGLAAPFAPLPPRPWLPFVPEAPGLPPAALPYPPLWGRQGSVC